MRWTDEAEIASVTPSRTSARASSAQLHVDSERPQSVRQLAGELHQMRGHDRGKNAGGARYEMHHRARADQAV